MTSIELEWTGTDTERRRVRFEQRASGGWNRVTMRHDGDEWVPTGHEVVADVELSIAGEVDLDAR